MSGYGLATVVVEAGEKSGARAQARIAVERGRPMILADLVVERNDWAKTLISRPGVHVASSLQAVLDVVDAIAGQQSGYVMRGYKASPPVGEHRVSTHGPCPGKLLGTDVTHWSTVPSLPAKAGEHAAYVSILVVARGSRPISETAPASSAISPITITISESAPGPGAIAPESRHLGGHLRYLVAGPGWSWLPQRVISGDSTTIERVCACYGLAVQPGASMTAGSRGAVGRIWRLELGDRRYAVKELFLAADEAAAQQEAALTAQLASAGIWLPGSMRGRDGRFLAWLAGADGDGGWVRLYRWIDGVPADLADPGTATSVGDLLGRLHAGAAPSVDDGERWYDTVPAPAVWAPLAAAGQVHGAGWATVLAQHTGLLAELTTLVTPQDPGQLVSCHRDLHPENVLVDSTGAMILLDWDDAGPACPDRELARLLTDWHVHDGVPDGAAVRRTMAAYLAAGGPGRIRDELSFGMVIACTLNFLHCQAIVALDPDAATEHREYAAAEAAETLTRLPTPRLLGQLVSLATAVTG